MAGEHTTAAASRGIDRRSFLRGTARTTAGLALGGGLWSATAQAAARRSPAPGGQTEISLDQGWSFPGAYTAGGPLPTSPPSGAPTVDLPHCVVPLSWHGWDPTTWEQQWLYFRQIGLPPGVASHRVLLDFDGALSATTPTINGHALPQTQGGYLPFSYELTGLVHPGENSLAVVIDGTWQQIPPSGAAGGPSSVDYLQPAGLSRHVGLRIVPSPAYIHDVFVSPAAPSSGSFNAPVQVTVDTTAALPGTQVVVQLRAADGGGAPLAHASAPISLTASGRQTVTVTLPDLTGIQRWSPDSPTLYEVVATLTRRGLPVHTVSATTGFRNAQFTPQGFFLNGERLILFGINRHQLFPYLGMSAPDRLQRRDAQILKSELNVNAVRMSHYPQSPAFLDACDELGIIVWEETPGWQYIGDTAWQQLWFGNVATMVARDRNRPSVVIWGVQPNETQPTTAEATQAKQIADSLDGTRPTAGTNTQYDWPGYVQPVFAYDDYSTATVNGQMVPQLKPPIAGTPYLVTESVGALEAGHYFVRNGPQTELQTQAIDHGMVHSQAQDPTQTYAGLLGWAGIDYASLTGYTVDVLKTPGVIDSFRVPKNGAAIYQSQQPVSAGAVIVPAFNWYFGSDNPVTQLGAEALVCSNCDEIQAFLDGSPIGSLSQPGGFSNLAFPPFALDTTKVPENTTPDLRLDGYVNGTLVTSRSFSADTSADTLAVSADDHAIDGDGSDATRILFTAVDRFGNLRAYIGGEVTLTLSGPGTLVGDNPFSFDVAGGVGAVFLRSSGGQYGTATVTASHPTLGSGTATVAIVPGAFGAPTGVSGSPWMAV